MWHSEIQKTIIRISESRVLFCSENEIPKIWKGLSNVSNKPFRKSEYHFRNIRMTYSSPIKRRNSENKIPICYISNIIFSISEINNHILRKLKTNILFQNFRKCRSDFKKLFSFFSTFAQIRKLFFRYSDNIFLFYEWNFKQPEIRQMRSDLTNALFCVRLDYIIYSACMIFLFFFFFVQREHLTGKALYIWTAHASIKIHYYYTRSVKSKWPGLVVTYQVWWLAPQTTTILD